jgi:outer membrane immunogenic protein
MAAETVDSGGGHPYSLNIDFHGRRRAFQAYGGADLNGEKAMTHRWLVGTAAAALTVAGAFVAQAADLPTRKEAPAPVFVPPPFTWTGFYIGVNAGGIWGSGGNSTTFYTAGFPFLALDNPGSLGGGQSGFLGGGQAGYNWQTGALVFGIETDFDGTSLSKSRDFISSPFIGPAGISDSLVWHGKASLDWLGTTRGRIGFVATPDNRLMFYGTGGIAYGGGTANLNFYDQTSGLYWTGNHSNSRVGWTLGAGVEYAVTNNITIKGEYLYYNLGNSNSVLSPNAIAALDFPGVYATHRVNFDGSIFRAGLNYKF